jgi:simple sugar transport system ATP-binding protein
MADMMVGRHVNLGEIKRTLKNPGEPLVTLEGLSIGTQGGKMKLSNVSISVSEGQIVGLAGVEGSGQTEVFNALLDPHRALKLAEGHCTLKVLGQNGSVLSARDIRRLPIGVVPADRLREAVLPQESLLENDMLGHDHEFASVPALGGLWVDRVLARRRLLAELQTFDVRPQNPDAKLGGFSGGNQQKFVMARELSRNPKLILCAQPTRGVDVGSIEQIHGELIARRDAGAGVLLISSQLDELMALSDVIHVMFEGRIVATFNRDEFDEGLLGVAMGGGIR